MIWVMRDMYAGETPTAIRRVLGDDREGYQIRNRSTGKWGEYVWTPQQILSRFEP